MLSGRVGCLLIEDGSDGRFDGLRERLNVRGVTVTYPMRPGELASAQEALYAVGRDGREACVAAVGEMWATALALAAQLDVERVLLFAPTDRRDVRNRRLERLKAFARRNLFFCVSDVLVFEESHDERSARRIDLVCRGLCNARVRRLPLTGKTWTNCKQSPLDVAAAFLDVGEFANMLAK